MTAPSNNSSSWFLSNIIFSKLWTLFSSNTVTSFEGTRVPIRVVKILCRTTNDITLRFNVWQQKNSDHHDELLLHKPKKEFVKSKFDWWLFEFTLENVNLLDSRLCQSKLILLMPNTSNYGFLCRTKWQMFEKKWSKFELIWIVCVRRTPNWTSTG